MILDSLKSFEKYQTLQNGFDKVYQFIKGNKLNELELGKYEIDGKKVYCTIWEGELRGFDNPKMEVHDSYIDIHVLLEGSETIGIKDRSLCGEESAPYDEVKDILFYHEEPDNYVVLGEGNFAITFPADAHAPLMGDGKCKKAIFKIHVGQPSQSRF